MKRLLKSATLVAISIVTAVAFSLGRVPSANAIGSCPTDPFSSLTPATTDYSSDTSAVNVGVKFHVAGGVSVAGVKFYKGSGNTGTHVAHLYDETDSEDVASATYTSETSSGWQSVSFSSPVDIYSQHTYAVWVSMPNGNYAVDTESDPNNFHYNVYGDYYTDPVTIQTGQNGLYAYSSDDSTVPTNTTYNNYWVSPVIADTTAPGANTGVTATDNAAGPGVTWSGIGYDSNSVDNANPVRTDILRSDGTNTVVVGRQSQGGWSYWRASDGSSTQRDNTALPGTAYTYTVRNIDSCGNQTDSSGSTVTTASQSLSHIFSGNPAVSVDTGETGPLTVGTRFNTSHAGYVWGVRFYRAAGTAPVLSNSGAHPAQYVGYLWDNDGTVLATAYAPPEDQASGWIDLRFSSPVSISASHDYVIGYYTPDGRESYTGSGLGSAVTNGDLTAPADSFSTPNGVYGSGSFPTSTFNSTWYGVDVDFYE